MKTNLITDVAHAGDYLKASCPMGDGEAMDKQRLERYTDHLISNCGYVTATGLSAMVDGEASLMSIYAVFKLECLKIRHHMNHFALRT